MAVLQILLQSVIALGILNVWLIRQGKRTAYRGGDAENLKEEFAAYGLPPAVFWIVGGAKVLAAAALLVGIWVEVLVLPAAAAVAFLMAGAVSMHAKVKDPIGRYLPATAMLLMSLAVVMLAMR